MGNEQKEKELRQVNIETESVSAVSEYMNTMTNELKQMEDLDKDISSPVMKKLGDLPGIMTNAPEEADVIKAHEDVGMTLAVNSKKHPKRVSRAKKKWEIQKDIAKRRTDFDTAERNKTAPTDDELKKRQADAYKTLQKPEILKTFMFEKSGDRGDEKLIKEFEKIQSFSALVSDYEAEFTRKKAKKNPTEEEKKELISAEARLKTLYDMRAYYELNEKIMNNKYYGLLPRDEMYGLSFEDLRFRLAQLYEKDENDRNKELIDFYQNLVRLKELGIKDEKSVTLREQEYLGAISKEKEEEEKKDPQKEMQEIASLYDKMLSHVKDKNPFLTENDAKCYKQRFFTVYKDRIEKYKNDADLTKKKIPGLMTDYTDYSGNLFDVTDDHYEYFKDRLPEDQGIVEKAVEENGAIKYTEAQKKGANEIREYLMERAIKKNNYSFVNRILDADFKQQLLIFYLVETGKEESAVGQDCFTALYNYTPDYANFKSKSNWKKISRAVRTSNSLFRATQAFELAEKNISDVSGRIEKDKENEENNVVDGTRKLEDKVGDVVSAIAGKGMLLRILYKTAGLHEDMPPDMAQDPVLRQRLFKEYKEIGELALRLRQLASKDEIEKAAYGEAGHLSEVTGKEDDGETVFDKSSVVVDKTNEFVFGYFKGTIGGVIESLGGLAKAMKDTNVFSYISSGAGGITALMGFVGAVMTATNIAADKTMSTADRWGQSLSVSADFLDVTGATLSSIATLGAVFSDAVDPVVDSSKWLMEVVDNAIQTTTAMDKLAIAGGAFAMGAGAVKMVAGGVQLGRAISSHIDISRSKDALAEKEKKGALTKDEEQLKKFLSHQKFETIRQDVSASVSIVAGSLAVVAGGLAMSVHLAPIGALVGLTALGLEGISKFISWRAKKKHWKNRVDDLLGVDDLMEQILNNHPNKNKLKELKESKLREKVRDEALAMHGFSSYEECFRSICTEYAELLYNKVFIENTADREMYLDAMKSLGLKYREPKVQGEAPKPSVSAMVAKMMG